MKVIHIQGLKEIVTNLKRKTLRYQAAVRRGLLRGGLYLQRESQKLVPVEFGFLRASAFTRAEGTGFGRVRVGYTSAYALFVHEAVGMKFKGKPRVGSGHKGKYWDPQNRATAKFLEIPVREKARETGRIVRETARKG